MKYTPGGARNFLVPSRLNPGQFYALAESPQIFKQLFMVAGFDRYFQIVRCFRDEDLRLDRQPEFTQIDIEMSFVVEEDVQRIVEGLMAALWKDVLGTSISTPLPRLTYADAMGLYGSDKPDLRFDLPLFDLSDAVRKHEGGGVELLRAAVATPTNIVKGWKLPAASASKIARSDLDKLEEYVKGFGARGLARARVAADGTWTQSPMKTMTDALRADINAAAGAQEGDLLFFQFGSKKLVNAVLGGLRLHLADKFGLIPKGQWKFAWITDFPLFEEGDGGHMVAAHHPFTSPVPADLDKLETDPAAVRARAYDLVLNGNEIAGGLDPNPPPGRPGPRLSCPRPLGGGRARQVRISTGSVPIRTAAPRRNRRRARSIGDAALRGGLSARRHRVPEDAKGNRSAHRGAFGRLAQTTRRTAHRAQGMTSGRARHSTLRRLDAEAFDILVVGGGATGAGIARDATLRGLRVALVDAGDFAGETSSQSSKLIHGGLRYLQYGDFSLVFEALTERRHLMATAPHLCRPVEFLFPAYRDLAPRLSTLGAGIALYNALALWRPPVGGRRISPHEVFSMSPHLRAAGLQGAQLYVDCQTDDARLVLETILDAETAGAVVASHVTVTELGRDRRGRVRTAIARDRLSGADLVIQARVIVNATGPFSDAFDRGRHNLRPTLGVHLVFDAARLPHGGRATVLRSPRDGRLVFMLPADRRTLVGTTDTDWTPAGEPPRPARPGDPIVARATDVDYLLEVVNAAFPPVALGFDDVVSTMAGLRPLVATPAHTPSATSREHELYVERDGLLTIVGGKLTTYRRMAEETVDRAIELLRDAGYEGAVAPCCTATRPLPGAATGHGSLAGVIELAPDVERHLCRTYGDRAVNVIAGITEPRSASPAEGPDISRVDLASRIDPDLPYIWAEVQHAARHELVTDIEDVLRRRIPLFRDARDQGLAAASRAAAVVGDVLGWSPRRRALNIENYALAVATSRAWKVRSVPGGA